MARWEPNARERLVRAAIDLFAEQGYDTTTVQEIAERAGLTKTTFFRHFSDKREVLFGGQEMHGQLLADGAAAAPDSAAPLQVVAAALDALTAIYTDDRREFAGRLRAVIAGNDELRERAVFKRVGLSAALADALHKRGMADPIASLAAELGIHAFYGAFEQWVDPANQQTLTGLTRRALDELRAATAALG